MAAEQIEAVSAAAGTATTLTELVADRGYHSTSRTLPTGSVKSAAD
jgi:hypothetical protein